jgi:hypothetical protein
MTVLCSFPPHILHTAHTLYSMPRVAHVPLPSPDGLTEENYVPGIENEMLEPVPDAPLSAHPPFQGLFSTRQQAMRHRKRVRVLPKNKATDVDRVKRFGRKSPHLNSHPQHYSGLTTNLRCILDPPHIQCNHQHRWHHRRRAIHPPHPYCQRRGLRTSRPRSRRAPRLRLRHCSPRARLAPSHSVPQGRQARQALRHL